MKKSILVLICLIIIVAISSCANPTGTDTSTEGDTSATKNHTEEIVSTEPGEFTAFGGKTNFYLSESGDHYELYAQIDGTGVYYKIWNEQEKLIDFGFQQKGGRIIQNGNVLEYSMTCGTSCRWVRYFDVENSCVSRFYNNPLATRDHLVVLTDFVDDKHCIVIQNMFDPASFYKVIELDPAPDSAVLFEAVFLDDQQIEIKYSSVSGFVTQVFNLYDTAESS